MAKSLKLKNIFTLRPFKRAVICPILIAETQVMLEKAVVFLVRVQSRPNFRTSIPRIPNPVILTTRYQPNFVENFSSLNAIAAEKLETDGRLAYRFQ
jgi:hypothetical protein